MMGDITKFNMFTRIHSIIWNDIDNLIQYCDSGFSTRIELRTFKEIYRSSVIRGKHIFKSLSGPRLLYGTSVFENNNERRDHLKYEIRPMTFLKIAGDRYTITFVYRGIAYTFRRDHDVLDSTNQMIKYQLEDTSDRFIYNNAESTLLKLEKIYGSNKQI